MDFLQYFWDAAVELDPKVFNIHECNRFLDANAEILEDLFENAGLVETVITAIEIDTHFRYFDDYWTPFLGGQGPAPTYVLSLAESEQKNFEMFFMSVCPSRQMVQFPLLPAHGQSKVRYKHGKH